ncbi:MAG TPA: hypothetical protein VKB86_07430 [Pyrinomonadaceae bacterium]|nr:hypothetical protein [Pyrinomonadaceae bacterium]
MKRTFLRLSAGIITFLLGISSVYLVWLSYKKPVGLLPAGERIQMPESVKRFDTLTETTKEIKPAKEEWEELAEIGGCTFGRVYYDPEFESIKIPERDNPEAGVIFSRRWIAFLRRDKDETVPFLISQIPNKSRTHVHIDPFDMATKGELAVYCLQFILKRNWDELKEDYKARLEAINIDYTNPQAELRKIIGTKRGATEMMNLWKQVYERQP